MSEGHDDRIQIRPQPARGRDDSTHLWPLTGHAAHDVGGLRGDGSIVELRGQLAKTPALVDACGISLTRRDRVREARAGYEWSHEPW